MFSRDIEFSFSKPDLWSSQSSHYIYACHGKYLLQIFAQASVTLTGDLRCLFIFSPFGRYYKGGVAVVAAPALFDLTVTKGSVLKYFSDNYELAYPASTQARDSDL